MRPRTIATLLAALALVASGAQTGSASSAAAPDPMDHQATPQDDADRNEPALAVSPRDPRLVVSAANHVSGRVSFHTSHDRGLTFPTGKLLPLAPGTTLSSDPGLDFDSTGRLYAAYISYAKDASGAYRTDVGGLTVVSSTDGGATWTRPVLAARNSAQGACPFADRSSIGVDRRTGQVLVAWQFQWQCGSSTTALPYVARSGDHGWTWSKPVALPTPVDEVVVTPTLKVTSNGNVLVTYWSQDGGLTQQATSSCPQSAGPVSYHLAISHDGGRSFTAHRVRDRVCTQANSPLLVAPGLGLGPYTLTGQTSRLSPSTDADFDPVHRVLLQVSAESDATSAFARIHVSRSQDGGRTWTSGGVVPAQVEEQQLFARLSVNDRGRATLLWIDQQPGGVMTATASTSSDGGLTWSAEQQVANAPTVVSNSFSGSRYGDYLANVTGPDGRAYLAWTDSRTGGATTLPVTQIWTRAI